MYSQILSGILVLVVLVLPAAQAEPSMEPPPFHEQRPVVAIVIDDLGYRLQEGRRAVELPGTLTYSFLPDTPHAERLAKSAHGRGGEIILHIPMEPLKRKTLGPGGLTSDMNRAKVISMVNMSLATIPFVKGVSNHMGSLLTRKEEPMRWLMQALIAKGGLYFVDSRTTRGSVAAGTARKYGIPTLSRDVFLDHEPNVDFIESQFALLVKKAKKKGFAIGVGHPYPVTMDVLERLLPRLEAQGIGMVRVSEIFKIKNKKSQWRLSLSSSFPKHR